MSKKSPIASKSAPAHPSKLQPLNGICIGAPAMTSDRVLKGLLIAALLLSGVAHSGDNTIRTSDESGQRVARFTMGDSRCVLKDDQVRCTPVSK